MMNDDATPGLKIVTDEDAAEIRARQLQRDERKAPPVPELPRRPVVEVKRRPVWLSHAWPPSREELEALYLIRKARSVGALHSADVVDGRLVLLVEWIGDALPPEILAYRKPTRKEPRYGRGSR